MPLRSTSIDADMQNPRRALEKRSRNTVDEDPSDSFVERRRALVDDINSLRDPQRLYMPGVGPLLDTIDPILLADHPENVDLLLPSALAPASRSTHCVSGLPMAEYQLRVAQAVDALDQIRLCRRLLRVVATKTQAHITNTQKTSTRARNVFDKAIAKQAKAVATYRVARKAIENLAPDEKFGPWKDTLLELGNNDLRGPGHEESETSASRSVPSWIWTTAAKTSTSAEDPDLNVALRVEWCKAQERAKRYEEEVELVVEEMRRTLATLELNAREWDGRAASILNHVPTLGPVTANGAAAYAHKQADTQRGLVEVFLNDWYEILRDQPLAATWLSNYTQPQTNQRRRLANNIKLYHSASTPPINGSQVSKISCVVAASHTIIN